MRLGISIWRWTAPVVGAALSIAALLFVSTPEGRAQSKTKASYPVNVNSADLKTLETLPGITPKLAQAIVDGRPYHQMSDLAKVKGLSKTKLNAIQDDITFGSTGQTSKTHKKSTSPAGEEETSTAGKHPGTSESTSPSATPSTGASSGKLSPTGSAAGKLSPGQTVNINTATAEELQALPGIGPTKAQAIVDYRNQNGKFGSAEDIEKVKGIKQGEFSKIKDYITVE